MMGDKNNPFNNQSGCPDPTAYNALKPIIKAETEMGDKVSFIIRIFKFIASECGFDIVNRIELRDRKTGKTFR